ncbi:MarR family transcriptional regulator [bacterium]|nr:MarR family transcriptional regulator [bacterium]
MDKPRKVVIREITEKFIRIHNTLKTLEKIPNGFGVDRGLSVSDIEFIKAVGRYPNINITELAKRLGITKGYVSQITTKLVEKAIVKKGKNAENQKEVRLNLSEKGIVIFQKAEEIYFEIFDKIDEQIEKVSLEEMELIVESFSIVENFLQSRLQNLKTKNKKGV